MFHQNAHTPKQLLSGDILHRMTEMPGFTVMENEFNTYNLGIAWRVFGNLDRLGLDQLLDSRPDLSFQQRSNLVRLHKRHPDRYQAYKKPPSTVRANVDHDFLRRRLKARKIDHEHDCELCGQRIGDLETTRIVDARFWSILHREFAKNHDIVEGTSVTRNGLLLCSGCHTKYDKNVKVSRSEPPVGRSIQIDQHGVIHLYGTAKEVNYKDLDNKRVPWADLIDKDPHYPNSATLKFALDLKIAGKNKRGREINEEFEQEQLETPEMKIKKRRAQPEQVRTCDISGCTRVVHIFDPDLELHLCAEHAEVQEGDIEW